MVPRAFRNPDPSPRRSLRRPHVPPRDASAHSKLSALSSSRSNEADDERSVSSDRTDAMRPVDPSPSRVAPQFEGEDTRLTSRKELAGFYVYGWAAEVFVVCGMGSFIPITLEQLARERGVLLSDRNTPCTSSLDMPLPPGESLHTRAGPGRPAPNEGGQCIVNVLGVDINTASFAMYTFSISVLIQALLIISMSGAADHGRFRKSLLLTFSCIGAVATMLFLPVTPSVFLLGPLFAIIGNCCIGASFVLLNSFLPLLVRYHPTVRAVGTYDVRRPGDMSTVVEEEAARTPNEDDEGFVDSVEESTAALLPNTGSDRTMPNPPSLATPSKELQLSTKISSYGMGIGYIAAILVQTISIIVIVLMGSTLLSLRVVLFIIGSWWLLFTFPAALWLRPRPGPLLRFGGRKGNFRAGLAYLTYSWRALWNTILRARRLKDVVLFLLAWFLISDAIATVSGTAVLYAKTTLNMTADAVGLILVIVTLAGIVGAFSWSRLSIMMGLRPSQTILACIALFELVPLYGLLGYIPFVQRWGFLGLQQSWEMYPVGAIHGFVMGGLSSYCRALFGELVPPGWEAAFFALYAVTDKGSSVFGPAIVGAIVDRTGEIRPAFGFLAVLIGLPFPILYLVDVERGRRDGVALAHELGSVDTQVHGGVRGSDIVAGLGDDDAAAGLLQNEDGVRDVEIEGRPRR